MKPKKTTIPGLKAEHRIVTETCLANRGFDGVISEVSKSIDESVRQLGLSWANTGAKIHVVVVIERPCDAE